MSGRTMHVGFARDYLITVVRNDEKWREYLPGFEGTREEAVAALLSDGREVFAGCDCAKEDNGACAGRPV